MHFLKQMLNSRPILIRLLTLETDGEFKTDSPWTTTDTDSLADIKSDVDVETEMLIDSEVNPDTLRQIEVQKIPWAMILMLGWNWLDVDVDSNQRLALREADCEAPRRNRCT